MEDFFNNNFWIFIWILTLSQVKIYKFRFNTLFFVCHAYIHPKIENYIQGQSS